MTGLSHLQEHLFRDPPVVAADSSGVSLIEAPGEVGEARLAARQLRTWIADGVAPSSIIVALRDLPKREALLREVFDEYAVPATWPNAEPIAKCGLIGALRRFWSLGAKDFPFRNVAALWRNNYFRPAFDPDLPLRAEALLRELDVPRGKAAILEAILTTAEDRLPLPLEDETMTSGEREARSQEAKRCLGLFQWFFALWDGIPKSATPAVFVNHLRRLAKELGLQKKPLPMNDDESALKAFGGALDEWVAATPPTPISSRDFERALDDLIAVTAWPKPATENGIRILALEAAANAECTHLLVLGLGEGSIPRFDGGNVEDKLAAEQTLFKSLLSVPKLHLVLSRPALDAKGQKLLPSTFLFDVQALFKAIPTTRQQMLIENYFLQAAMSDSEKRVQQAMTMRSQPDVPTAGGLDGISAKRMADARFRANNADHYSGKLSHPAVRAEIANRFGPRKIISASALETYIGCPFKYWMQRVLGVEPLAEPAEEVDAARRGSAIHRALRRYHDGKPHERGDTGSELERAWSHATKETAERAPGSVAKVLWQLERRRVQRSLNRYSRHWGDFRAGWAEQGAEPLPHHFEAKFGYPSHKDCQHSEMTLTIDDVEVRLGGIIDRVDFAQLNDGHGFWIIDYKTGGSNFRAADLAEFEKLQLPLYALAVERVFRTGENVRPLGLAYWLIVKDGPKAMLPDGRRKFAWAKDPAAWPKYREQLERVVAKVVASLRSGDFRLAPRRDENCEYCDYATVCRINQQRGRFTPLKLLDE